MLRIEDKIYFQNQDIHHINDAFNTACKYGDLSLIKYLLTSKELKINADIHNSTDYGFLKACVSGQLEAVQYLLASLDLKDKINDPINITVGITKAAYSGNVSLVDYLVNHPIFKANPDMYKDGMEIRSFLHAYDNNNLELIDYLILEYQMPYHEQIMDKIQNDENIKKKFEARNLYNKINNNISLTLKTGKLSKI